MPKLAIPQLEVPKSLYFVAGQDEVISDPLETAYHDGVVEKHTALIKKAREITSGSSFPARHWMGLGEVPENVPAGIRLAVRAETVNDERNDYVARLVIAATSQERAKNTRTVALIGSPAIFGEGTTTRTAKGVTTDLTPGEGMLPGALAVDSPRFHAIESTLDLLLDRQ